jgi:hypothetical protein
LVSEQEVDELRDDKLQQIIDMDQEFDNDPIYKKYEKMYSKNKVKKMISSQMGMDLDDMSEEELEDLLGIFTSMIDISKPNKGDMKNIMTRETLLARKDSLMDIVNSILEMAVEDDEFELASKLRDYNKLLQTYN